MNNVLDVWMGWSRGYEFVGYQAQEKLAKGRAQSYQLASFSLSSEISIVAGLIIHIVQFAPQITNKEKYFQYYKIVSLAAIPFAFLVTKIKEDKESDSIKEKVVNFFNDYIGTFNKVVMIAVAITCLVLGDRFTGGAVLAGVAYADLNQMGYVPERISVFVRSYMPVLSTIAFAMRGQYLEKAMAVIAIPFQLFPVLMKKLVAEKELQNENAPVEVISNMTYAKIESILNAKEREFDVNPAHASKEFILNDLEEDQNLEDFLKIFNEVSWQEYNQETVATLRENLTNNIELISKYSHEVNGNSRKILSHLKKLNEQNDSKEIRNIFQVLGSSKEVFFSSRLRSHTWQLIDDISSKVKVPYPQRIQRELQILRRKLLENEYIEWVTWYKKKSNPTDPTATVDFDKEVYTSMYDQFCVEQFSKLHLGFYPVKGATDAFSSFDWVLWKFFAMWRQESCETYISQLYKVLKTKEFDLYCHSWINQQTQLEAGERELLKSRYDSLLPSYKGSFHRLILVELGALKYNPKPEPTGPRIYAVAYPNRN